MTNEMTNIDNIVNKMFIDGDISTLKPIEKVKYYEEFCKKLNLNPLTRPFQLIRFQGKEVLYATKDATEQLRKINKISITKIETKMLDEEIYLVTVTAQDTEGRQDSATAAINIKKGKTKDGRVYPLDSDGRCNAIMKAETKAKRRVTLSICGLGCLDDSETDTLGSYKKIDVSTLEQTVIEEKEDIKNTIEEVFGETTPVAPEPPKKTASFSYSKEKSSTDKPITEKQSKCIYAILMSKDIKGRQEQLDIIIPIINREITTTRDLTMNEAKVIIDALQKKPEETDSDNDQDIPF